MVTETKRFGSPPALALGIPQPAPEEAPRICFQVFQSSPSSSATRHPPRVPLRFPRSVRLLHVVDDFSFKRVADSSFRKRISVKVDFVSFAVLFVCEEPPKHLSSMNSPVAILSSRSSADVPQRKASAKATCRPWAAVFYLSPHISQTRGDHQPIFSKAKSHCN